MECTIDDVIKIGLRIGTVAAAERVDGSEKLLKLAVDFGDEQRQILAGIGKAYTPEEMVDRQVVVTTNLAPRMMMGLESQGMVLCANGENGPVLLSPSDVVPTGAAVQ